MPYEVKTTQFAGPFDLLLHLIMKQQVDIYEVKLSEIVDAYLWEIEAAKSLDLEIATEFLLIASTLVELKSRSLLPEKVAVDLDEEFAGINDRDLLIARLMECRAHKEAANHLLELETAASRSFPRQIGPLEERFVSFAPDLLANATLADLRDALLRATAPKPRERVDFSHVIPIKVSVAKIVAQLVEELPNRGRVTFRQLTASLVDRIEVVAYFLAILELFNRGFVELEQREVFGDIAIVWQAGNSALLIGVGEYGS